MVYLLEVLSDCCIHLVSLTNELLLLDDGPHHRVAALDLQHFFRGGIEGLQVACPEVSLEGVKDLVVVELSCELQQLGGLMGLLGGGVPDGLVSLLGLGPVVPRNLWWHMVY